MYLKQSSAGHNCKAMRRAQHQLSMANFVQVDLSTHAIGGLSKNDFVVAAKIDSVPTEYSPKWLKQHKEKQAASSN